MMGIFARLRFPTIIRGSAREALGSPPARRGVEAAVRRGNRTGTAPRTPREAFYGRGLPRRSAAGRREDPAQPPVCTPLFQTACKRASRLGRPLDQRRIGERLPIKSASGTGEPVAGLVSSDDHSVAVLEADDARGHYCRPRCRKRTMSRPTASTASSAACSAIALARSFWSAGSEG
jgi:hypothetical protein